MKEYQKALEQYIDATNTHRFSEVAKCLASDAIYFFGDATCKDLASIQAYFEQAWETIQDEVYGAENVEWLMVSADMATCVYDYTYTGIYQQQQISGGGRATNVFAKQHDGWKLVHEHLSNYPKTEI